MLRARRPVLRSVAATAATTAVVVGTAGAVRHHQDQKYQNQAYAQQQQYAQEQSYQQQQIDAAQQQAYQQGLADAQARQQMAAPPPAPAPAPAAAPVPAAPGNDLTAQLQQLSQLHNAGVLSDQEFAAAKQKLLAG